MKEFANVQEPSTSFDAIVCCQAVLEWITMDDVGRYNFRPRCNFNVTPALADLFSLAVLCWLPQCNLAYNCIFVYYFVLIITTTKPDFVLMHKHNVSKQGYGRENKHTQTTCGAHGNELHNRTSHHLNPLNSTTERATI